MMINSLGGSMGGGGMPQQASGDFNFTMRSRNIPTGVGNHLRFDATGNLDSGRWLSSEAAPAGGAQDVSSAQQQSAAATRDLESSMNELSTMTGSTEPAEGDSAGMESDMSTSGAPGAGSVDAYDSEGAGGSLDAASMESLDVLA